jgi:RNA polymerase sigma-54 factor
MKVETRVSASMVMLARLLVLPAADLGDLVAESVTANPALELDDRRRCPVCGRVLLGRRCRWCQPAGDSLGALAAGPLGARDELRWDLGAVVEVGDRLLADRIVDELDDRGLLGRSRAELARALRVDAASIDRVLDALIQMAPPGVGAASVVEALVAQLDAWTGDDPPPHSRAVLEHAAQLVSGGAARVAASLGVDVDVVDAVLAFVAQHLNPSPLDLSASHALSPPPVDVLVEDESGRLLVAVAGSDAYGLMLSPSLLAATRRAAAPEVRRWADERVAAARAFLHRVDERAVTVRRVAQLAVDRQEAFVREGSVAHVRLTRAEVARELSLHESTVSRAVDGKRIRLPSGAVLPFAVLFGTNTAVKARLADLMARDPRPSDARLAAALAAEGHAISRRTVAKYRSELRDVGLLRSRIV